MSKTPKAEVKEEHNGECIRYLKKFELVETETQLPIQGQVRDPEDLYTFLKDLENEQVPKVIAIYLDNNHLFLGHQVFVGASPLTFDTQLLYHYYALFLAKRFMLIINHPSGNPTPDDEDIRLIHSLRADSQVLSFKPFFADYIVVGAKSYFSLNINDGTSCHCGHQEYIQM